MDGTASSGLEPLSPQRELFDIPDDVAYLNAAYMAPALREVGEAGRGAIERVAHPWQIRTADFFDDVEELRRLFAAIVAGDPEGVALIPSASYGIGVAAANVAVGPGDRIVVLAEQFPSNVYPWRELAKARGGEIATVPRPREGTWTGGVIAAIDERTAVVAVPNCHWTDGSAVDLVAVAEAARRVGAAVVLDLTQSLGAAPFAVDDVRPDFVVAAAYKWLLGPYGIGFLWVAPQHRNGPPLEQNWIGRAGAEDFAGLVDYRDDYQPGARRFDVGERSNFVMVPMAVAALRRTTDWRPERVAAAVGGHTSRIEKETRRLGLDPVPASARLPHFLGVRLPEGVPGGLVDGLAQARVYVSVRGTSIRVSPHVWTTEADVDRLLDVLTTTLGRAAW